MDQEIRAYVEQARQQGMTDEQIRQNLATVGWDQHAVEAVFADLSAENRPAVQNNAEPVLGNSPAPILPASKNHRSKLWISIAVSCLVLAGIGYTVFKVTASPSRIFSKFLQGNFAKVYQSNFNASYFDAGSDTPLSDFSVSLKNISFSMSGKASIDTQNESTPKTDSEFSYTLGSGGTTFSTAMKIKLMGKDLYLNVGDNPFLNLLMGSSATKVDWIHINLEDGKSAAAGNKLYAYLTSDEFKKQIGETWQAKNIVSPGKYLGNERINGTTTYHYAVAINKQVIKDNFHTTLEQFAKADPEDFTADTNSTLKAVIDAIIDRTEIKKFEAWIGVRDHQLYRISLETSAPSLASLAKLSSSEMQNMTTSADAKRLADIRQIATALELYYNDKNAYPKALSDLVPTYIGQIPVAPAAAGSCSNPAAGYTYSQEKSGTSYALYSCFGKSVGGYTAGMFSLTPAGIQDKIPCPPSLQTCALSTPSSGSSVDSAIKDVVSKLDFTAQIKYNADYSDYGKTVTIEAPSGAKDLKDLMNSSPYGEVNALPVR